MEDIIILDDQESSKNPSTDDILKRGKNERKSFQVLLQEYFKSFKHIKIKEKIVFYRLMSTMLYAGMSLIKGIVVLEKQEKNPLFKKMLGEILIGLQEGKNLSECLEIYPASFGDSEVGIIKSGEKTGKLNEVMLSLADQVEKVASISGKLKSALIYPAMIMLVVLGVIGVMMTMVVPKLLEIFEDKSALPPTTQTLILISDVFVNYRYIILIFLFFVYFGITFYKKTPT